MARTRKTTATQEAPERPLRTCVACTAQDDHPRHDVILQLAPEYVEVSWHLDCHAIAGCESCAAQTAGADGATGDAMRAVIVANNTKES